MALITLHIENLNEKLKKVQITCRYFKHFWIKGYETFQSEIMKNEKSRDFHISRFISNDSSLNEFSTNEELEKFIINLNHSGLSESVHDQIHFLYVALTHIENVENEILGSSLTEETLFQNMFIEDINCLKMMVIDCIRELSDGIHN